VTSPDHDYPSLISDRVIHERARLLVVSYLAAHDKQQVPFMEVQKAMDLSRGNLSIQLKTLEDAAYVTIEKKFVGKKPQTLISLTEKGRTAIKRYLDEMEAVLKKLRL
jgi:DNA-binding MarR family transcriptional regulator